MKRLLICSIVFFLAGCAGISVKKYYNDTLYPATNPKNITILPKKPVERKYKELGEITVRGASNWIQVEKIFRSKSAEMGADAVYTLSQQQETKEYLTPNYCYDYGQYYYPYQHFGWRTIGPGYYYPRGYYYCYGPNSEKEASFISAVGIAIKYLNSAG